jgi:hypothetical protein
MQSFGNLDTTVSIIRIQKLFFLLVTSYFFISQTKKLAKDGCVITFLDNLIFFLGEKHKFKYFKNLMVKVCKIWCNDVYMSLLQCDIFWWKLMDRNFFNTIFNTKVVLRASPLFAISTVLQVIISKRDIQIC